MAVSRKRFTSQVSPELLAAMREIARNEGRPFYTVLEDAMREYVENRPGKELRASVQAHFRASVEQNRHLGELLSK